MKFFIGFVYLLLFSNIVAQAQDYSILSSRFAELKSLSQIQDADLRKAKTEKIWEDMASQKMIPLVQEDSVLFLYKGQAQSISWMGDFNGWGYDRSFKSTGTNISGTDIWFLKTSFPKDARLDYKVLVNGSEWIIDPYNPNQQWSGVGGGSPNSELRMPNWKPDPASIVADQIPAGKLQTDILFNSESLGYQITYSIYLPHSYTNSIKYPVIYVTDGYEYLHERMGNMKVVLDNLIAQKKIEPLIAVFIDHREPVNRSNNRRMQELAMNAKYLTFFENEFIPQIESSFSTYTTADKRAILGTSMGGLTSAYFAFTKPGIFGMSGIQSPAFRYKPDIYTVCDNPSAP